jgi:3-oxoacyl-[acyl-carrier protein] reductase/(S)-1-phenylethanol dehydrogenase
MERTTMGNRLQGKNVVLTGGAGGVGRFLAQGMVNEGAFVAILDVQNADETIALAGAEHIRFERCDLTNGDEIRQVIAKLEEAIGGCDILVHCAAYIRTMPFEELPFSEWRRMLGVNLDALYHLSQATIPNMKKQGWGRIVAFASTQVNEGTPEHVDYVASKAGIIGASRVLAKELGRYGITVNTLSPGLTKTDASTRANDRMMALGHPDYFEMGIARQSLKRTLVPQDLVGPLLFLLSDEAAAISGQTLIVDGGGVHG